MGNHDRERPCPSQRVDELAASVRAGAGVERGQGLVEEQDARVSRQRSCQRNPLAFASREGSGASIGQLLDAEAPELLQGAPRRSWRGPGIPKATFRQALRCGKRA